MPDPDAEAPAAHPAPAAPAAPPSEPVSPAPTQASGDPRIRRLRWFDIPAVAALDAEIFGPDAWSTEYYWAAVATPGQSFVVIESPEGTDDGPAEPGALLGFAGLGVSGPQADVLTLAAHPAARGRGIGRALLTHLLDTARSAGCEVIHLDVRSDNTAAHGLYTAHGFTELARRPGYYTGADAVVMRTFL